MPKPEIDLVIILIALVQSFALNPEAQDGLPLSVVSW